MNEGYIKFKCNWVKKNIILEKDIIEINKIRKLLFEKKLIGCYSNGIGYGNISVRHKQGFIITGSATGHLKKLSKEDYSLVKNYNINNNELNCEGLTKASSESLSHAIIYEVSEQTNAVIHIHSLELWKNLIENVPTTNKEIEYGIPEMAYEIKRLFSETKVKEKKVLVMGGHESGIISFGKDLEEAYDVLLEYLHK